MAVASNPDTPKQEEEKKNEKNNGTYKITELIRIASMCVTIVSFCTSSCISLVSFNILVVKYLLSLNYTNCIELIYRAFY